MRWTIVAVGRCLLALRLGWHMQQSHKSNIKTCVEIYLLLLLLLQVLAKAEPTALAGSAEVVRAKLVTASAIAKGEVSALRLFCSPDCC
jgi:hypothetical protein